MPDPKELQDVVKHVAYRLRERRVAVAVVGDMILDTAIEGVPAGRHPDIGVPILREGAAQESIGGAGNIAITLARLGVEVTLFGVIGSDLQGRQLENMLERRPFTVHLVTERGWPTPRKDWIYQRQEGRLSLILRIDSDRPLSASAREELVGEFRARCPAHVDVVILADHNLGSIGPESLALIGLAKDRGAKLVAIPRSTALRGQPLDAIAINAPEMRNLYEAEDDADARALAARYAREFDQQVFLTLLGEGIQFCPTGSGSAGTLLPGYPLENAHWMGARDMAAASVAIGLALNLEPMDNARLATALRHLAACQLGNGRLLWRDIFQFVGLPDPPPTFKIA